MLLEKIEMQMVLDTMVDTSRSKAYSIENFDKLTKKINNIASGEEHPPSGDQDKSNPNSKNEIKSSKRKGRPSLFSIKSPNPSPDIKRNKFSVFNNNLQDSNMMLNLASPTRKRNLNPTKLKLIKLLEDCELNMRKKAINTGKEIQKSIEGSKTSRYITLNKHLSFSIKRNDTICILGDDLNGAAGFFLGLVGDIDAIRCTDLTYSGSISYLNYKKSPLLLNCNIRDNIIFGEDFNLGKLEAITNALKFSSFENLKIFDFVIESPNTISTIEKNLIFMARTLYCEKDLYIFHDVFHNLTSSMEIEIFKIAVSGFLQDKSVIYNSNDTYCMKCSTRCWYMCQGAIRWRGEYSDIEEDSKDILRTLLNN